MRAGPSGVIGRVRDEERGQTFTEYVMIVGLLTVMIIVLTDLIVPQVGWTIGQLVTWMAVHVSTY
jgi:Flp pilus assembly pilin Flp